MKTPQTVKMAKQDNKLKTRTDYLARPNKYHISKKYKGEKPRRFKTIERPVVPIKNQRLNMLAENASFKMSPKYVVEKKPSTFVKRTALEATLTPRLDHLSRPFVRSLQGTRRQYAKSLGKPFVDVINEKIQMSWDTIYYFNAKSKKAVETEKRGLIKDKPKRVWNPDKNRLKTLAGPRRIFLPPKPEKREKKKLRHLIRRIRQLAKPPSRNMYKRPSQDSFKKENLARKEAATKYTASERIQGLYKRVPERYTIMEPKPFFGVKRGALEAEMTERLEELAAPRPRANAPEMDLKENPYDISPNALKYKATPRIIKLAKPIER